MEVSTGLPATQGDQMSLLKASPKCSPTHFLLKLMHDFHSRKNWTKHLCYFCNLRKSTYSKQSHIGQKFAQTGTDVLNFKIFSPKNSAKISVVDSKQAKLCKILIITLVFQKNANFFAEIKNRRKL
jgi:hypothetical protein